MKPANRFTWAPSLIVKILFFALLVAPLCTAATPSGGTLSTNTTTTSWDGFPGPGTSPQAEATCVEGTSCDTFTLTLSPGDYTGKRVRFKLSWTNQFNDYDVYVHSGSNAGKTVGFANNGIPETSQESTFDVNTVVTTGVNDTYTVHVVYFAVGAQDPYHGTVSLEVIPPSPPNSRSAIYVPGTKIGLTFSRNRTVFAHGASRGLEPSARVDFQGNAYAGSIRGLSAGDNLWRFDLNPNSPTYDPFLKAATVKIDNNGFSTNPAYKGQPDAISPSPTTAAGGDGGGDMDMAVGFKLPTGAAPGTPPALALTSLVLANISSQRSTNRADSYSRNPAGNVASPIDDRNWMEFYGGDSAYLAYRDFTGLQATSKFFINRSDDGGLTYGPAILAAVGGNTTGDVTVDQRDGTVYFCFQGASPEGNKLKVAVGHPRFANLPPTEADYTTVTAATGQSPTIAALFPVCKAAQDGTVYAAYSDGGKGIFLVHSTDQGATWAKPVQVSNLQSPSTSLFPWITTGAAPGAVGVAWYGIEPGDTDDGLGANNDKANWKVFFAESLNATSQTPTFYQAVASDHYTHGSNISLGGFGGTANRNLGDFFQLATDPQGLAFIAFDDDSNDFSGNTYVTHQTGGLSLNTGKSIKVSGIDHITIPPASDPQVKDERHDAVAGTNLFPPVPDVDTSADILNIQYGCDVTTGKTLLTAVMRLSGLTTVPPLGTWRINFASSPTRPGVSDHADQWFLQASTDATATPTFTYGTAVRNSDGSLTYTSVGPADFGVIDTKSSSVTLKVDIAKLNALQTHGVIGEGTKFIGLRGSASSERESVSTPAAGVSVGISDSTRGGSSYRLTSSQCVGAASSGGDDDGAGEDSDSSDRDDYKFHDNQQHPESSDMQYNDRSRGMNVQSVNALRAISYSGACVSFAGDALVNGASGYVFNFNACDLSSTGVGIGTFSISMTGPNGFWYQKTASITSGFVKIHAQ